MEITFRFVSNALLNTSLVDEAKSKALFQKAEDLRQRSKQQEDSPKNHSSTRPSRKEERKTRTKTKNRIKSQKVAKAQGDRAQRYFRSCQVIGAAEKVMTRENVALVISGEENKSNVGGVSDKIPVDRISNSSKEPGASHGEDDKTPNASTSNLSNQPGVIQREDDSISEEPDAVQGEDDETPNASGARQDVAKAELALAAKESQSQRRKREGKKRKTREQPIKGKNKVKFKSLCVQVPLHEILIARKKYLQTLNPNQNSEEQQAIDAEQDEVKVLPIKPIQLIEISDDENEEAPVEFSGQRWSSTLCQPCGTYVRCNI